MVIRIKPLDLSQIQTGSVRRRNYRLTMDEMGAIPEPQQPLAHFYRALPKVGEAAALLDATEMLAQTVCASLPVIWVLDGGLYEAGCTNLVAQLMRRGAVQGLAMNGEAALRDFELAFNGATVEDLASGMADGQLGLARETAEGINAIINDGVKRGFSIGECLGRGILDRQPRHYASSLLATGAARLTPTTVHVGIGADGFHRYPGADGAMLGKGSLKDCFMLASHLSSLPVGGLLVSLQSDATLTQTLLHGFALARNLNDQIKGYNLIRLGAEEPLLQHLPGLNQSLRVGGALELILPLLVGGLFSLVE